MFVKDDLLMNFKGNFLRNFVNGWLLGIADTFLVFMPSWQLNCGYSEPLSCFYTLLANGILGINKHFLSSIPFPQLTRGYKKSLFTPIPSRVQTAKNKWVFLYFFNLYHQQAPFKQKMQEHYLFLHCLFK